MRKKKFKMSAKRIEPIISSGKTIRQFSVFAVRWSLSLSYTKGVLLDQIKSVLDMFYLDIGPATYNDREYIKPCSVIKKFVVCKVILSNC